MGNLFQRESEECRKFRDALDELPLEGNARSLEEWREELPDEEAAHERACTACQAALEQFAETRDALAGMATPEAGPWFTARVMAAIAAKEKEDGVWISVRRLAPRLVAVSALLLVVGGSWALEQRSRESIAERRSGDVVFDSPGSATWYDDGLGTMNEVRP